MARFLRQFCAAPVRKATARRAIAVNIGTNWHIEYVLNRVRDHANKWLHTDVLRDEWGFEGFVMSDWGADNNLAGTFEAQMDMWQSSRNQVTTRNWITDPTISTAELGRSVALFDRSVKNILRVTVKTAAFQGEYGVLQEDGTYASGAKLDGTSVTGLIQQDIAQHSGDFGGSDIQKASAAVNKQAADEAIVLFRTRFMRRARRLSSCSTSAAWSTRRSSALARTRFWTSGTPAPRERARSPTS
ncbi:MAG: hypothetical protein LBJ10_02515 [Clostridiales bacterium]|jgi:beta-glucosidase-like glycosyl hydrolase|nr:hypothetical protein [Clostridiales bacterium]